MPDAEKPDYKRTLPQLRQKWSSCIACSLGEHRLEVGGKFVFGEGATNNIMFVGEGPGSDEESTGRPFSGRTGKFFRDILARLGVNNYYLTNAVCCRSCSPRTGQDGQPLMRRGAGGWEPVFQDEPPTPPQFNACLPRLQQELYLVDPTVVVGLGAKACTSLMEARVAIQRDRGEGEVITIPGRGWVPILHKSTRWVRRHEDPRRNLPRDPFPVRYHFIPTLHPSFVNRKLGERGINSPFYLFIKDLKKAIRTHEAYLEMVFGEVPIVHQDEDEEALQDALQAEQET